MMIPSAIQRQIPRETGVVYLFLRLAFSLLAGAGGWPRAYAAPIGKSYFFATREACAASGAFRKSECDAAFANALDQLRDSAPSFSSRADCQLRFRLCELRRDETAGESGRGEPRIYAPLALGIEIANTSTGAVASPVLAVEPPPGMFPAQPVSRSYAPQGEEKREQNGAAFNPWPPADHFEAFSSRRGPDAKESIGSSGFIALGQEKGDLAATRETQKERRTRLRSAPFVE